MPAPVPVPLAPPTQGLQRGACPSVHHPFAERDGDLLRVRVPGGVLQAAQAAAVAAAAGDGTIEITNRANLQLRGVVDVAAATARLVAGGVVAAGGGDDRRNVLAGPMAGIDPAELIDVCPLVADIASYLERSAPPGLSAKFCVVVDGGGSLPVWGRRHDVGLRATTLEDGSVGFEMGLGNVLAPASPANQGRQTWFVAAADALAVVAAAAELRSVGVPRAEQAGAVAARAGCTLVTTTAASWWSPVDQDAAVATPAPLGPIDQRPAGLVALGAMPVLGRIDPPTLAAVADVAATVGCRQVRLTPWRSVLLPGVARSGAAAVSRQLAGLGLVTDPADPAAGVVACAGSTGCPAGLADVQTDARRLIARLRADRADRAGRAGSPVVAGTAHLSGCPKRCASRADHDVTLVAGPTAGSYGHPPGSLTADEAVAAAFEALRCQ